jgi:hypothetical protein
MNAERPKSTGYGSSLLSIGMRNASFFATQNGRPDARSEFAVPVGGRKMREIPS